MHSLLSAWHEWAMGQPVHLQLFGLNLLWWARVGKLLEFSGIVTIIADLVGPPRIRRFGASLHRLLTPEGVRRLWNFTLKWWRVMYFSRHDDQRDKAWIADMFQFWLLNSMTSLLSLGFAIAVGYRIRSGQGSWVVTILVSGVVYLLANSFPAPLLMSSLILAAATVGWILDTILIEPVAWLLDNDKLENIVNAAVLIFVVVGFHFDLLAS